MGTRHVFRHRVNQLPLSRDDVWLDRSRMTNLDSVALYLNCYGQAVYQPGAEVTVTHVYWSVQLGVEGALQFQTEREKHLMRPGEMFILRPGVKYTMTVAGPAACRRQWIAINNGPLMALLINQGVLRNSRVIRLREPERVFALYDRVHQLAMNGDERLLSRLSICAYELVLEMADQAGREDVHSRFEHVVRRVVGDLTERQPIGELATYFGVSQQTLAKMFRRHLKCPPNQYLIQLRLEKARELLAYSTMPIRSVARECGYRDSSFFAREFRRYAGEAPRSYRNKNLFTD